MSTTTTEQVIMNGVSAEGGVRGVPAEITVNEIIIRSLVNVAKNLAIKSIKACGLKYGFNAEEEIKLLNLENLTLLKKPMRKGGKDNGVSKKNKKEKKEKNKFPMPFEKSEVLEKCCQGLSFNRGLFTQCLKDRMENGNYCNGCQKKADKNSSGNPDCGTIASRQSSDLYSFKDPKGRSPISYLKFLENNSLTVENAVEEAEKNKIKLSSEHLTALMITEKKILKGRPKKIVAQIKTDNVTDLFSKLNTEEIQVDDIVADNVDDIVADNVDDNVADNVEIKTKQNNKQKLTSEEKEIKQAAFDLEHATKKINRDKKIAEEKLVREMKLQALKDEKEAKLKQEKDEKEAKLKQEKDEKEAKKKQEKDVKEAKKKQEKDEKKESKKESKKEAKKESKKEKKATPVVVATPVADEPRLSVKKIEIAGKRYLLSSATSILYCPDTQKELGIWNPETKTIESLPEEEEEEVNSDEEEEEEEEEEEDIDEEELKEEAY